MAISETKYSPLGWNGYGKESKLKKTLLSPVLIWKDVVLVILGLSTTLLLILLIRQYSSQVVQDLRLAPSSDTWTQYTWYSKYSSPEAKDVSAVDEAWEAITPAHGIVAVDHQWAFERQLPETMSLPSDGSKGVYIIDAYHQLHCLTIIRKTFFELARGQPLTYPAGHATHCFDSVRQYVMCTADDTLLYTWGRNITGDGQLRKCRNWSVLRDWATENTACYRDSITPIPINDHFGHCDGGTDGIVLTSW